METASNESGTYKALTSAKLILKKREREICGGRVIQDLVTRSRGWLQAGRGGDHK